MPGSVRDFARLPPEPPRPPGGMLVALPGRGGYEADERCRGIECPCHDDEHECFPGGADGTLRCIYRLDYDHQAAERWDEWRRQIPFDHPRHPWAALAAWLLRVLERQSADEAAAVPDPRPTEDVFDSIS